MDRLKYYLLFLVVIGICQNPAFAKNQTESVDFPRLGMWWPDPEVQPHDDIVRYNFITLFDYQESFVAPLKALNPQLTILNSTNASEVSHDDPNISKMPAEWFLTQVGSTLSQPVNAIQTTFHVKAIIVTDGNNTFDLFVPGDTALVDSESVKIIAINKNNKTLTVERGFLRPASAHPIETRIAAHITFWPDTWLANVSSLSNSAIFDQNIGAERWSDYNARMGSQLLANPSWDGLLVDRVDPDQSWLVGGSTARTIDPDQSNTLITNYSAFNEAWNEGLRYYQSKLREFIGSEKIIFSNWGIDNYTLVNGNNYEGFPLDDGTSYRGSWHDTVFGNIPNVGSYSKWMDQGLSPNLTMIETYEDDSVPEPDDLSYINPCSKPDFSPNYRKMRFGLTTALLNNGYYSWEINTNGHGSLCLKWFDEYDNAGKGRGYLGQPLGAAYQPSGVRLGDNMLLGGTFESQSELDNWDFWVDPDSYNIATVSLSDDAHNSTSAAKVEVTQANGTDWQVALSFKPIKLVDTKEYTISFWAKADKKRSISVWAQKTTSPWDDLLENKLQKLNTDWQYFEYIVKSEGADDQAEFIIGFGQEIGSVWIDDIRIQKGNNDVWRRDFEGGSVVVNATLVEQKINLGKDFRKIKGSQNPIINNGSLVNRVTLAPLDGVILLSVAPATAVATLTPVGIFILVCLLVLLSIHMRYEY